MKAAGRARRTDHLHRCVLLTALLMCGGALEAGPRQRISLNRGWRFYKYASVEEADSLIYDVRPDAEEKREVVAADAMPTEAVHVESSTSVLKPWILPSGNGFIADPDRKHIRPEGNPGCNFPFVRSGFDDRSWELVDLPHDWAVKGPFYEGWETPVGGGMGRLPSPGVAWYRRKLDIPESDAGTSIFLDMDGAMSYAMVWLNGKLVGGWPYGYASWRLDLTPYVVPGGTNQLAIRLDNPADSSRWYPGGGIYRNVWLVKTRPVHVAHWGTRVTTRSVSEESAVIDLEVIVGNDSKKNAKVSMETRIYALDSGGQKAGDAVAVFKPVTVQVAGGGSASVEGSVTLADPRLWGPPPHQRPHLYAAETVVSQEGELLDQYSTVFGIRSLVFDPVKGIFLNGKRTFIKGVNQHHDLGALGAAFNTRAAERQLEVLQEMGCNAIRIAHNPPAPELLDLTDRMGFLVVNEIFDCWERKKTPHDFHLIFPEWHEQDLRAFIRRDRNHPSVILWSFGNEVGEQYTGEEGAEVGRRLYEIVREEDDTRPATASMNYAKPDMPFPHIMDVINLNYQGEGIRDTPAHAHLDGIRTAPQYSAFHETFPGKVILSSENAAALSTRGEYLFPVHEGISSPVTDENGGGNSKRGVVSAYGVYAVDFGSSPDKVFTALDRHPFVAGGFVWSGWDYLGEPTPYYRFRSSYFGMIDLAGFRKDRFYLYQARWRPELPMAHILPHWNWSERIGEVIPVHVFTSGDEAELFLNGKSLGRRKKGTYEYRLRWDEVRYEPGELKTVAYKDGKRWAEDGVRTTGEPFAIELSADREGIRADGADLSFITARVVDKNGLTCPRAGDRIRFRVEGPGEIVATDNGDPTSFVPFPSVEREAFNGLCLAIVRGIPGRAGTVRLTGESEALRSATVSLYTE